MTEQKILDKFNAMAVEAIKIIDSGEEIGEGFLIGDMAATLSYGVAEAAAIIAQNHPQYAHLCFTEGKRTVKRITDHAAHNSAKQKGLA